MFLAICSLIQGCAYISLQTGAHIYLALDCTCNDAPFTWLLDVQVSRVKPYAAQVLNLCGSLHLYFLIELNAKYRV